MRTRPISTIQSSYYIVIMTLVNTLLVIASLELDNANGEEKDIGINDTTGTIDNRTFVQESGDPHCKSPCPSSAEMCIEMCA